jgi:hypothetical protein
MMVVYKGQNVCSVKCEDALDARVPWLDPVDLMVDSWMDSLPKRLRGMD